LILSTVAAHHLFLVACAAGTVLLLFLLITTVRLHPALALVMAALGLGLASGMPFNKVPLSFTNGVGDLMGRIVIVLALGAILGRLLASSGGAAALGGFLVENCGTKGLPWALLAFGMLVGMPMFFEVGLVLMMPIVAEAARRSSQRPILVAMPLLAGLSIVHGTMPPQPAAMLAATQYHADIGRTMLCGLITGIPAAALAGPVLGWLLIRLHKRQLAKRASTSGEETLTLFAPTENEDRQSATSAGPIRAAAAILLPVALIFAGSWADSLVAPGSVANQTLHFVGNVYVALLIGVLVALVTLGRCIHADPGQSRGQLLRLTSQSFEPIANVLVILAAAGGLSGILRDTGAAQATVNLAIGAHIPILVLAWLLAAVVRVSMGSATVAMAVASGVLAPMIGHINVRPELLVLATGTGSLILSHVNDPGFWMIQSFFKMDVRETLATWTLMETVLSVAGLGTTLTLAWVLG
jgi:GntP family gluconate:H+ symporter